MHRGGTVHHQPRCRECGKYIALIPNDPNPYDSYAELLMKTGRFDESIVQYRKALSHDQPFGASYVGIAADEMFAGRHGAAVTELEEYYSGARDDGERRTALLKEAMIPVDAGATDKALHAMGRSYGNARAIGDTANMSADAIAIAELNGFVALNDRQFDGGLAELALADQENPAVVYAMARAHAGKRETAKAKGMSTRVAHMTSCRRCRMSSLAPGLPRTVPGREDPNDGRRESMNLAIAVHWLVTDASCPAPRRPPRRRSLCRLPSGAPP